MLRRSPAAKRGAFLDLLTGTVTSAVASELIPQKPAVAVDATGLDSRHASRYFVARSGGQHTARRWPKLTIACDTHSHFIAGATVTNAPPKGQYRSQMPRHFGPRAEGNRHPRVYGQRWRVESAFSRHKRRLGSAVAGRSDDSRMRECYLRVLTHNLMLLAATG